MDIIHNFDEVVVRRGTDAKKYSTGFFPPDVSPMWIADTDFKCPQPVVDSVVERAVHGVYGYPDNLGEFSRAASHWMKTRFGFEAKESDIEFAPGVIPGVVYAMRTFSSPGDKVVLQTPCYPPFREAILNNGRHILANPLVLKDGRYEIDFDDLESKLKDIRARILLLCSPHNPTGRVFSREELSRILDLCVKYDVFIISDEIHCDLAYSPNRHTTFLSLGEQAQKRATVIISPSKTFNTAGFRTAAMVTPDSNIRTRIYHALAANKGYGRTIMGQLALCVSYLECGYYADQLMEYLAGNLALARKTFAQIPQIDAIEPEATYLLWLDCRKTGLEHKELEAFFAQKAKVGFNSGTTFGEEGRGFMRMNLALPRAQLQEALDRIKAACDASFA